MFTKKEQLLFHYHTDSTLYNIKQKGYTRWLNTGGREVQSAIDIRTPTKLILNYQTPLIQICKFIKQPPKKILLLGLGGGSLAHYLQNQFPESALTIVDREELMLDIACDYFMFTPHQQTTFICEDAYHFLKAHPKQFDLIICDIFGMNCMPEVMMHVSFYQAMQHALTDKGLTATNFVCDDENQFLIFLNWYRFAFNNKTLAHGLPQSRNAIIYGFNDRNWGVRLNQLVNEGHFEHPVSSEKTGAYLFQMN